MKILITGGAGFIGSHLTDRLLAKGEQVLVIDNYSTGRRDNLKSHPNLTVVEGSIADTDLVLKVFADFQPEQVVHAAAAYKDPENWVTESDAGNDLAMQLEMIRQPIAEANIDNDIMEDPPQIEEVKEADIVVKNKSIDN